MSKTKPLAGKTITLPVWVRAEKRDFEIYKLVDGFDLRASASAHLCDGEFLVAQTEVTFTVPDDFDPVAPMVAAIEAKKKKLTAEFTAAVMALNKQLSELQAIECEVSA
jgi:hypothetical protein